MNDIQEKQKQSNNYEKHDGRTPLDLRMIALSLRNHYAAKNTKSTL